MVFIYILKLEQNKYYVGKTTNPKFRIDEHFSNEGSEWTKIYKPINVVQIVENCDDEDEDKYTIKYMKKFGINNVRGGIFSKKILPQEEISIIQKMIDGNTNRCYLCGESGHFSKNCPNNNTVNVWICDICEKEFCNECEAIEHEKNCRQKDYKYKNIVCFKCGRKGHYSNECYANTHIDGRKLSKK
jgi:predicted GIY-YIG superfamily endonuclease